MVDFRFAHERRRDLVRALVFLVPIICAVTAGAARIRVSQESRPGAGDFHRHVLGHIDAMQFDGGVNEIYAYNEWNRYSFGGKRPVLRANVSHLFFARAREGLTLFIVHDAVDDPDGGSAAIRIQVIGNGTNTRLLLRDDAYSVNDSYAVEGNGNDFRVWHSWYPCCTDGLVLGPLAGPWKIYVHFTGDENASGGDAADGLTAWEALAHRQHIRLALEKGRRVLLEPAGSFALDGPLDRGDTKDHQRRSRAYSTPHEPEHAPGASLLRALLETFGIISRARV